MAGEILLRPEDARGYASRMRQAEDDARERFATMRADLDNIGESFRGMARDAFDEQVQQWDRGAQDVLESLNSLSIWLDKAAETLEGVDQDLSNSLKR